MNKLKEGSKEVHTAFEYDFFGISTTISNEKNPSFMAAYDADSETELLELKKSQRKDYYYSMIFSSFLQNLSLHPTIFYQNH